MTVKLSDLAEKWRPEMDLPTPNPRRLYNEEEPDGYLESDQDYIENNLSLAVKLLEAHAEGRITLTKETREI
jgi:hypothetical protein